MDSDRLDRYRTFQQIVANLGPTILHGTERALLLDAGEGLLLSDCPENSEEMLAQGSAQTSRMSEQSRDDILSALALCGPGVLAVN